MAATWIAPLLLLRINSTARSLASTECLRARVCISRLASDAPPGLPEFPGR